jgi:hypothetical protein
VALHDTFHCRQSESFPLERSTLQAPERLEDAFGFYWVEPYAVVPDEVDNSPI